MTSRQIMRLAQPPAVPPLVLVASNIDWGVIVDAYLCSAARIGDRYAAEAFLDRSGVVSDGMTVATPPVTVLMHKNGFMLVRSQCLKDHYVIVTEHS